MSFVLSVPFTYVMQTLNALTALACLPVLIWATHTRLWWAAMVNVVIIAGNISIFMTQRRIRRYLRREAQH